MRNLVEGGRPDTGKHSCTVTHLEQLISSQVHVFLIILLDGWTSPRRELSILSFSLQHGLNSISELLPVLGAAAQPAPMRKLVANLEQRFLLTYHPLRTPLRTVLTRRRDGPQNFAGAGTTHHQKSDQSKTNLVPFPLAQPSPSRS